MPDEIRNAPKYEEIPVSNAKDGAAFQNEAEYMAWRSRLKALGCEILDEVEADKLTKPSKRPAE